MRHGILRVLARLADDFRFALGAGEWRSIWLWKLSPFVAMKSGVPFSSPCQYTTTPLMTSPALDFDLRVSIRSIPDYPKPGIMFRDITTLLGDARAFRRAVDELVQPWAGMKIDKVAGIEARGFILGGAVAHQVRPALCRSARRASCLISG